MIVNTKTLQANPEFAKALCGIWYETLGIILADTPAGKRRKRKWASSPAPITRISPAS